jgi:uncharacterized membrane protein YdjX (TVP38/TMEM64 family)
MRKLKITWYLVTIIPILLVTLGYLYPSAFFSNQETIREFISGFGILAPVAFIILQIVQVVLTPISHYAVSIAGGFLFGTWAGFIYNWIGRVVGTAIAFYLGRRFGRRVIKKLVKKETLLKYDGLFYKGKLVLFLMYFLPFFPDDELSYLAGFSSMRARYFIFIMALGHIGGSLALSYVGSGLTYSDPLFIFLSLATLIGGVGLILLWRRNRKLNINLRE